MTITEVRAAFVPEQDSKLLVFAGSDSQQMYKTVDGYNHAMVSGKSPTLNRISETSFSTELHIGGVVRAPAGC